MNLLNIMEIDDSKILQGTEVFILEVDYSPVPSRYNKKLDVDEELERFPQLHSAASENRTRS